MATIHPELIERYQLTLERDPRSQVFAPLSEAYRKMGLLEEAFRISTRGVQFHPNFASGHIALANIFMEKKQWDSAKSALEKAAALSPENILAYQQLAECCLQLKKAKEALKAFKMVLFFSPENKRAALAVQKLETLTADEYEDDVFAMDRIQPLHKSGLPQEESQDSLESIRPEMKIPGEKIRSLETRLSVIDAYCARSEFEKAWQLLETLENEHPGLKEIQQRKKSISARLDTAIEVDDQSPPLASRSQVLVDEKLRFLEDLKQKIQEQIRMRDVQSP